METKTKAIEWHEGLGILPNPQNQFQQAIWYLYNWGKFSLMDVINDSMFFKFQTRLSEIENDHLISIANRERKKFTNRFGYKASYCLYSKSVSKQKLAELFDMYE